MLVLGLYMLVGSGCQVLAGFGIEKIGVDSTVSSGKETTGALSSKMGGDWDWFCLDITDRIYLMGSGDEYSWLRIGINFPKLSENLDFDLNYSRNQSYYLQTTGVDYQKYFGERIGFNLGAKYGLRDTANGDTSEYRYNFEEQTLGCGWDLFGLDWALDLTRIVKNYPINTYLSSEKLQLEEGVIWKINPGFEVEFGYQETTCDYPFDAKLMRAYWKEQWIIGAEYRINERCRLTSEYSLTDWDKGFDHYQDSWKFDTDLYFKISTATKLSVGIIYNELQYYLTSNYYDPDGTVEEEDTNSRSELKLGTEVQHDFTKTFFLGIGCSYGKYDYKSAMREDVNKFGFYGKLNWKLKLYNLYIKAVPAGDLQHNNAYYQLKVEREL